MCSLRCLSSLLTFHPQLLLLPHPAYTPFVKVQDYVSIYTNALLEILQDVLRTPSDRRAYGQILKFISVSQNRMWYYEAISVVEKLVQWAEDAFSNSEDMLALAAVEIAVSLLGTYKGQLEVSSRERLREVRDKLRGWDDGRVQVLTFNL